MSDEPPPPPRPRWGVGGWALVVAAFAVGFWHFPLTTVGPTFTHLPGDPADNRLNNYVLEHGYRYLLGLESSFWDAPMMYPWAGATRTSDAHLGMLPVYAAFRLAGLSPEGAFQGYFLVPFVLNFAAAAWAVRRLGFGPVGAAVAAYLFTYGLPVAAQLQHVQLFPRFLVPPAAVLGWEHLRNPRPWRAWSVAGCVTGQTYLSVYIGVLLVAMLGVGVGVAAILFRGGLAWRGAMRWPAWAAALAGMLAVTPLLDAHARGAGRPTPFVVREIAPKPGAWLTPPDHAAGFPELADLTHLSTWEAIEQQLFPGVLTLLALPFGLAAVVRRGPPDGRRAAVALSACVVLVVVVVVTRWKGVWLYEPLLRLPGATGLRATGRVVLVLLFPMGVVLGGCAEALVAAVGWFGRLEAAVAAVLVVVAVAADHRLEPLDGFRGRTWGPMRNSKAVALERQGAISEAIRAHPKPRLVYVFPTFSDGGIGGPVGVQCEAMRAAQDAGLPCVNGWSGYRPPGWDFFPGYRGVMNWLVTTGVTEEEVGGLVLVGNPRPDHDPIYEAVMRAALPSAAPVVPFGP